MDPEASITVVYIIDGSTSKSDVLSGGEKEAVQERRLRKIRSTENTK